jgi:hypothetical protein
MKPVATTKTTRHYSFVEKEFSPQKGTKITK